MFVQHKQLYCLRCQTHSKITTLLQWYFIACVSKSSICNTDVLKISFTFTRNKTAAAKVNSLFNWRIPRTVERYFIYSYKIAILSCTCVKVTAGLSLFTMISHNYTSRYKLWFYLIISIIKKIIFKKIIEM